MSKGKAKSKAKSKSKSKTRAPASPPPAPSSPPKDAPRAGVSAEAIARARVPPAARRSVNSQGKENPFAAYIPGPNVVPKGDPILAMDDLSGYTGVDSWAYGGQIGDPFGEGQRFPGFQALSLLALRAEFRIISEVISTEMVRKWITLKSLDGSDKTDKIKEIEEEFTKFHVRECFQSAALHDGFFGRGHLFLDFGDDDDRNELMTSIGDGTDDVKNEMKIKKDSLKRIGVIEPVWIYPQTYNARDPLKPDWYKPVGWYVFGKAVDASRLLTFIGREVPDMLKPAFAFAGLSMTQMAMPYVDNWVEIRRSVTAIVKAFSVFVLSTNATDVLAGGSGEIFLNRLDFFNATRDNRGVMGIDKDKEDFKNVSASLAGLDHLQAQSQEHMCSVSRIPLVKFTGISPSGLNATSEGELQVFADHILAYQEHLFRPNLTTVLRIIQLNRFGEVDHKIGFEFGALVEMTSQEEAELRKVNAETGEILVRSKAVASAEERARVVKDTDGPYTDLDPKADVEFPMTENEKADVASKVATTVSTLVAEGIIEIPVALQEIKAQAQTTGFGTFITDDIISQAEEDAANAPDPAELALMAAGGGGGGPGGATGDPKADPALAKRGEPGKPAPTVKGALPIKSARPVRSAETTGVKPTA